jgi:hypothetical protein
MRKKLAKRILISALIIFALWMLLFRGCVESNFLLAEDSRLPKWVKLPDGYTRADVNVSLFLHLHPFARIIVREKGHNQKKLIDVLVKAGWHEATQQEESRRGTLEFSPHYYYISYKGVNDIIKFPCKGPVFWMVDSIDTKTSSTRPECPSIDWKLIGNPW